MLKRIGGALALSTLLASSLIALVATPANAARSEITISALGWWWEDATREEREVPNVGTITIETPNPFCPSAGSGTGSPKCSEGRIPIEVQRGDYETQNKISAVSFDMTLIPIGSKINKFTATFREAKEGCYDKNGEADNDPSDDVCEETSPVNVGEHQLQACLVDTYFGDGEARPYKEAPNYTCTNGDPIAKRKEVKSDKDGEGSDFYWTFDLTDYARKWTSKFSAVTGIMIVGVPPKGEGGEGGDRDTWRVVLTGPKFQNGVKAVIDYIPADDPVFPTAPTDPTDTGTTTTTTTTGSGDFGSTGTTGGVDTSGTGSVDSSGGAVDSGASPGATPTPAFAFEEPQPVEELPGYIWLAILGGLVGFSLVRSIVMEKTAGMRPNGVLATIHRLNEERGGASSAAASAGPLAAFGAGVKGVLGKLNFRKKG